MTKRADRLQELDRELDWPPNVWMGVSVENRAVLHRIDSLRTTGARVKFLSIEPLLEALPGLNLTGVDWVIVGGESGPRSRPIDEGWVRDIRDQCLAAGVAFFFKQWGGSEQEAHRSRAGRPNLGLHADPRLRLSDGQTRRITAARCGTGSRSE